METIWLILLVLTFAMVTFKGFTEGWNKWYLYYVVPLICLAYFFFRRSRRKKREAELDAEN